MRRNKGAQKGKNAVGKIKIVEISILFAGVVVALITLIYGVLKDNAGAKIAELVDAPFNSAPHKAMRDESLEPISANEVAIRSVLPAVENSQLEDDTFLGACRIDYIITNESDTDLCITEFEFNAASIAVDYTPQFTLFARALDGEYSVRLTNTGWTALTDIEYKLEDANGFLPIFVQDHVNLSAACDDVPVGESVEIFSLNRGDISWADLFLNKGFHTANIDPVITLQMNSMEFQYRLMPFDLNMSGILNTGMGGGGGLTAQEKIYGLLVDTGKRKYTHKESIRQIIPAHKVVSLPFFFFPDKSCTIDFHVTFTMNDHTKLQSSENRMCFQVSSAEQPIVVPEKPFETISLGDSVYFPFTQIQEYADAHPHAWYE